MTMNEGEWITLLEPMMPAEENRRLEDLSMELAQKASALNNQVKMRSYWYLINRREKCI
jgi:hypothetical protein